MVLMALSALILGILWGLFGPEGTPIDILTENSEMILNALMFFVGISIGLNKSILHKLREHHFKALIIPCGIIVGSFLSGILCSLICGMPLREGTAIASGMGWYSLSGVMLTEMAGAQIGSIAFLSNLLREILSFFSIPWIAKHLNYYTCIAPAGATSEDTTLPMMLRYTNEETVVLAVFNGILCSTMVPILIRFCFQIFP